MRRSGDDHSAVLRRLRQKGHDHRVFQSRGMRGWVGLALLALIVTAVLPFFLPQSTVWLNRTTPAISLFFFLAAVGWWLRMGMRAFVVAAGFVVLLYLGTFWTPIAYDIDDFTIITLLSSFAIFALAGFNLVFILEEIAFDAHRELHLVHRVWSFAPTILVVALAIGLPITSRAGIFTARSLWLASLVWLLIFVAWWTFRAFNTIREGPVLRELHLLAAGTLAASGVVDLARLISEDVGVLPSILMYVLMVGSWIYVSYTTMQRTHFLLAANNAVPWLCFLLSASFALLQHASFHYSVEGAQGVTSLLEQRIAYLVFGIWVGVGFYVVQSLWRVLRNIRDDRRMTARGRIVAGSLARVAESLMTTERRISGAAATLFEGMDRMIPGRHYVPQLPTPYRPEALPTAWDLDVEGVTRVDRDSEE